MRYYRFRFLHGRHHVTREITIASTHEQDAQVAAWSLLESPTQHRDQVRKDWRLLSVVITPVTDLDAALSS